MSPHLVFFLSHGLDRPNVNAIVEQFEAMVKEDCCHDALALYQFLFFSMEL